MSRKLEWVEIALSNGQTHELPLMLMHRLAWDMGSHIEIERLNEALEEAQCEEAREIAIHYIAYQPRTRKQTETKLRQKDVSPIIIEETLDRLEREGILDDEAFSKLYVQSWSRNKVMGPRGVEYKLKGLGVDTATAERAVQEFFDSEANRELLLRRLEREKKGKGFSFKQKAKLFNYYLGRGYFADDLREVFEELTA